MYHKIIFNFILIDKIEFLGKIKIECVVKKTKNKKLIIICKVNKWQNGKKNILNYCDGHNERNKS